MLFMEAFIILSSDETSIKECTDYRATGKKGTHKPGARVLVYKYAREIDKGSGVHTLFFFSFFTLLLLFYLFKIFKLYFLVLFVPLSAYLDPTYLKKKNL